MLVILKSTQPSGKISEHVILTKQARLSIPSFEFPEIPAGMLDGSGDFAVRLDAKQTIALGDESLGYLIYLFPPSYFSQSVGQVRR